MSKQAQQRVNRALDRLEEEVTSDEEILDLLDNFELLASGLAAYKLPAKKAKRGASIDAILKHIGKTEKKPALTKLGKDLKDVIHELRQESYDDDDDSTNAVEQANDIRERVLARVREWMGN